ncbi:MAG: tyrosine--tRNA ligase [Candidatus Diapherotrites archaeon]|nr:tyrosine--tRNA ligase [Candidatus Diapherotrites archaeon]
MDIERRFELITRNTAEILTASDLRLFLETGVKLKHYIGFEISGKMHLGTGLMTMAKVKDFIDAKADVSIFLADWHTWINNKLGGDREVIKKIAVGYFKEGFKASMKCLGADPKKLKFVLGSELYHNNDEYWATFVEISKHTTLARIRRSITIMGRKEGEAVNFAMLLYPPMQVADIFIQGITLPHAGIDQRKAQVIAREVALKLRINPLLDDKGNKIKPVAVHHHLLLGLSKPPLWPIPKDKLQEIWSAMKMSKSNPNSCVFIHDSEQDIRRKLNNAFCPAGVVEFNPVLDWTKYLIFRDEKSELYIERPEKFGGDITYYSYSELEKDFAEKKLHPLDLKKAVAEELIKLLEPARKHFEKPKNKAMLEELENLNITR